MKHILIMLALLASSTVGAHFQIVHEMRTEGSQMYLAVACVYTGGECPVAPRVIFTPTRVNNWGFYRGTNAVFITDRCLHRRLTDEDDCNATIIHEMVHYIVGMQGRYQDDSCNNERIAWAISNKFLIDLGRYDLVNFEWRNSYAKCQPSN